MIEGLRVVMAVHGVLGELDRAIAHSVTQTSFSMFTFFLSTGVGNKKWKNLYFVLNAKELQLYFFDNPRVSKFLMVFFIKCKMIRWQIVLCKINFLNG